jgi:hypothetical protein
MIRASAPERVDYQIDNPDCTVHAPTTAAFRSTLSEIYLFIATIFFREMNSNLAWSCEALLAISTGDLGHGTFIAPLV